MNQYQYDFSFFDTLVTTLSGVKQVDLLPYYRDSAHINHTNSGQYYWPHDGHHNAAGYSVMAKAIRSALHGAFGL